MTTVTLPNPVEFSIQWGAWSAWAGCSRSCGTGRRVRIRSCVSTTSGSCEGVGMGEETQDCNTQKCPPGMDSKHAMIVARMPGQGSIIKYYFISVCVILAG